MNKLYKQFVSVLATGSLLLSVVAPVSATTLEISGNGSSSDNDITFDVDQTTSVTQTNDADVYNNIDAEAKTGGNDANDNTGGDVSIETGDATTEVKAATTVNSNSASVDCCATQDVDVLISGNGSDSDNTVDLDINQDSKSGTYVKQTNTADVTNEVDADAKTGWNDAEDNTGGDVSIETGDAETSVTLSTTANANWAQVGDGGQGSAVSLKILGNGTHSDNDIDLDLDSLISVIQSNDADVYNDVDANAKTGGNDANDNTGGDVSIETGDAETTVEVDNMVNFNWADVDCGCLFDVLGKIAGNGSDSDNTITADLYPELFVDQDNTALGSGGLNNDIDADAKTGHNDAEDNTGSVEGGDPSIETGDAESTVEVSNAGNSNVFGEDVPSDWPEFEFNFNLTLSWSQLMALLGL
ncbi:hypothetical protein A3A79_00360 [Candidatus Gottesmanbacteria bacterium RIFCSPLOWO2_01_FULL_43_11b]|uniref:Uncharacterized protein n=1 Tax=Candidatus Gottesmanbacteria bacterium RIFCSPLOWO2_01_FULL_43_11b TaxID=1798392 RepID=A0A1F6AGB5_9BACT|nr:MAG: hypothetical protein A3A79_00360 [Candidatus Gottesmanbacteria bacterium RIFCSPLOWO2_01_FULL_43_11b]